MVKTTPKTLFAKISLPQREFQEKAFSSLLHYRGYPSLQKLSPSDDLINPPLRINWRFADCTVVIKVVTTGSI